MITKRASLDNKEGVSSHRRNAFFKLRRGSRQIERVPHSRDRRPRLSAFLSPFGISLGNIPSFGEAWEAFYRLCSGGQTRASVPTFGYYFDCK